MSVPRGVDERLVRVEQAIVAILVLGGFVFGVPHTVPVAAFALFGRALAGESLDWLADGSRIARTAHIRPATRRTALPLLRTDLLGQGAVLVLSSLLFGAGAVALAWLIALIAAGVAAVRAATGASLARAIARRRH